VEPAAEAEAGGAAAQGAEVSVIEPAAAAPEEAEVAPPIDWDPDRYTVAIEEPDWFAGEVGSDDNEPRQEPIAPPATDVDRDEPEPDAEAEPEPEPEPEAEPDAEVAQEPAQQPDEDAADAEEPAPDPAPEPAAGAVTVSSAEETMLWFGRGGQEPAGAASTDEGADEMEVAGGGGGTEGRSMPGARELDDALAALDALARGTEPPAPSEPEPMPPPEPESEAETVVERVPPPSVPTWPVTDAPSPRVEDPSIPPEPAPRPAPDHASVTPASRAYRRLRRIFPG
jgi:hypothetical protein